MQNKDVGRGLRGKRTVVPIFGRAAEGVRKRADEAKYMRPAEGKEALWAEIKRVREGIMGGAERRQRMDRVEDKRGG